MPASVVAVTTAADSVAALSSQFALTCTPGNSLVLLYGSGSGSTGELSSVTDTAGNVWTIPDPPQGGIAGLTNSFLAAAFVHGAASPGTVTLTRNSASANQFIVLEIAGVASLPPDVAAEDFSNTVATTDVRSAAGTPSEAGELLIGFANFGGAEAVSGVNGGWTLAPLAPASGSVHLTVAYKVGAVAFAGEQAQFTGLVTPQRPTGGFLGFAPTGGGGGGKSQQITRHRRGVRNP